MYLRIMSENHHFIAKILLRCQYFLIPMATYDEIIEMFIERLKNPKLLPIMIRTAKCPNRNNSCKKKHGEIKIESFDKKKLMNMMELDIERNRWVKIKLTDYEKIVLKKRAKADKTTMSHHARKKI